MFFFCVFSAVGRGTECDAADTAAMSERICEQKRQVNEKAKRMDTKTKVTNLNMASLNYSVYVMYWVLATSFKVVMPTVRPFSFIIMNSLSWLWRNLKRETGQIWFQERLVLNKLNMCIV